MKKTDRFKHKGVKVIKLVPQKKHFVELEATIWTALQRIFSWWEEILGSEAWNVFLTV